MTEYAPLSYGMEPGLYLHRAALLRGSVELHVPYLAGAARVGLSPNYAETVPKIGHTVSFETDSEDRPQLRVHRTDSEPIQLQTHDGRAFDEPLCELSVGYHAQYGIWLPTREVASALQTPDGAPITLHAKTRVFWQHINKFAEHGTRKLRESGNV